MPNDLFTLNQGQQYIVDSAVEFYNNSSEQVFQFAGPAGTGKSVVLNAILNRLGIRSNEVAPMSYIGAAAIVMRLKGLTNAKTCHSWLFNPKVSYDEDNVNTYFNRPNSYIDFVPKALTGKKLIIIDEAGSVPHSLKDEIESRGIKIIAAGDLNQLPPVGDSPAYLYTGKVHQLTEIMRQASNSAIIYLATRVSQGLPINNGFYGDVLVIDDTDLNDQMLLTSDIIICSKNKTRDGFNKYIRENLLHIDSQLPVHGEKLVCRKNNWKLDSDGINLANGLTGHVANYPDVRCFDGKTFTIDFQPSLFHSSFNEIVCDYDYYNAPYEDKERLKRNKYNKSEKFELAYAITTHISQGSQYANGIYFEEYLNQSINNNLNYTGVTRFSNFLIYVKHRRKFN